MSRLFKLHPSKPTLVLTGDYELFLGLRSGTVGRSLIEPTQELARTAEGHGRRFIFFVDVLHILRLEDQARLTPSAHRDLEQIRAQLGALLRRGHELQLHLHPQWLDAEYREPEWVFPDHSRYALTRLRDDGPGDSLESLSGCVSASVRWLNAFCESIVRNYRARAFRAGGLCLQPFGRLAVVLKENGIHIDSSVAAGLFLKDGVRDFDFRRAPGADSWAFCDDPCVPEWEGGWLEMPLTTFNPGLFTKARAKFLRRAARLGSRIMGDGASLPAPRNSFVSRLLPSKALLTYDYWDAATLRRALSQKRQDGWRICTLLGHPKFLSRYGLTQLDRLLDWCGREGWA